MSHLGMQAVVEEVLVNLEVVGACDEDHLAVLVGVVERALGLLVRLDLP